MSQIGGNPVGGAEAIGRKTGGQSQAAGSGTLGGHCEIGDFVFIGGLSAVHQFTRIGSQVMVGGVCGVRGDVIPFGLVNGQYASLEGLNIIGMKRRKFTRERLATARRGAPPPAAS